MESWRGTNNEKASAKNILLRKTKITEVTDLIVEVKKSLDKLNSRLNIVKEKFSEMEETR